MVDPITQATMLVPPGGHVAGIIAATDEVRGVGKAPANVQVAGILVNDLPGNQKPLEFTLSKGDQEILNPRGINVIRDFRSSGLGCRVWGARTLSSDAQWTYINVRRLFIFVEQSVIQGTQWVVFEPNDETTWLRVRRSLARSPTSVWHSGALVGATPDEAFFVRCDNTTMTQDDIFNGPPICLVGMAPARPAEFADLPVQPDHRPAHVLTARYHQGGSPVPTAARNDPYSAFNFLVDIDGITVAGFSECSGLTAESDHIEYRTGDMDITVSKLPGLRKYANLMLKHGLTSSAELWQWRLTVVNGKTVRRSGSITLLDEGRKKALEWTFSQGWP